MGSDKEQRFCSFCGAGLGESGPDQSAGDRNAETSGYGDTPSDGASAAARERGYCPWEDQEHLGLLTGLGRTIKESILSPDEFFSRMPAQGGFLLPLLFALIVQTLGIMIGYVWGYALENPFVTGGVISGRATLFVGLLMPVFVFLGIVLSALLVHAALSLIGGAMRNFEATFRVVCYASGPELFTIVPVVGGLIGLVWKIYITVVGLRSVHNISTPKAAAGLLIPFALVCGLLGALTFAVTASLKTAG